MTAPANSELLTTRRLPLHDPQRLGALLCRLEPRLIAVALRFTRDPETARDVVQSAFEKVIRHGDRFQGHSRVSTWVHRIVANEALMWLRTERRRGALLPGDASLAELEIPDAGPGPSELFDRRQRAARLRAGIEHLSSEERDVVVRCGLAEWSYAEYARHFGLQTAAVKSRAYRARRRLEALLGDA